MGRSPTGFSFRKPIFVACFVVPLAVACSASLDVPRGLDDLTTEGGTTTTDSGCTPSSPCVVVDAQVVYVYPDAATHDAAKDATVIIEDEGGEPPTTCSPQAVASFTFQKPGKYLGKCSDDVLGALYDACIGDQNTISGCDAAKAQFADCSACAFGGATAAVEHPWLVYDDRVTAFPNFGLCMATIQDETADTDCGVAYTNFYTCLNQACVTPCAELASPDAFDTCRQAALDQGICTKGSTTALGAACTAKYQETNPTYGFCTNLKDEQGKDLDDRGYMIAIARLSCGIDPKSDAGPKDAGSDADASK